MGTLCAFVNWDSSACLQLVVQSAQWAQNVPRIKRVSRTSAQILVQVLADWTPNAWQWITTLFALAQLDTLEIHWFSVLNSTCPNLEIRVSQIHVGRILSAELSDLNPRALVYRTLSDVRRIADRSALTIQIVSTQRRVSIRGVKILVLEPVGNWLDVLCRVTCLFALVPKDTKVTLLFDVFWHRRRVSFCSF